MIQLALIILSPVFILWACDKSKIINSLSPVVWAYIVGVLFGNIFVSVPAIQPLWSGDLSHQVLELSVPLAICLLLATCEMKELLATAKPALVSFGGAVFAVFVASFLSFYLWGEGIPEAEKVVAMLIGVYTGGSMNLSAVGTALDVAQETFILVNTGDLAIGGLYIFFLLSLAKPVLSKFLHLAEEEKHEDLEHHHGLSLSSLKLSEGWAPLVYALLGTGLVFGVMSLLFEKMNVAVFILLLTTMTLLLSKKLKATGKFQRADSWGQFILLIFCLAMGSLADVTKLFASFGPIMMFTGVVLIIAVCIHLIVAKIMKVELGIFVITSTAAIFGPPFVPPVAQSLKRHSLILPGISTGLLGYAVGNYLGIAAYWFLMN